jgi:hypothetical protein
MSASDDRRPVFPHALGPTERAWCAWLLPTDRPAYAPLAGAIVPLVVIGIGRWGEGDLVLGAEEQQPDLEAPMEPVAAYGEITFDDDTTLSISIHHPDDEARVELHLSGPALSGYERRRERSRWCYSYWTPGDPSPSGGPAPRQVRLDEQGGHTDSEGALTLAIDALRRILWLHDGSTLGNTLVPVTNFYNELMLLKGIRDPEIALRHRRLFEMPEETSDDELRAAFRRYNVTWRKVDADRLGGMTRAPARSDDGLLARLARSLRGGSGR